MSVVTADADGVRWIGDVLDVGTPVVLPFPTPLPYVVSGVDAGAVNRAKGRPEEQPTGVLVADFDVVVPHLELDADSVAFARWLSAECGLNLLLPVGTDVPEWMRPSTSDGQFAVMLSCLESLRPLLDARGHLYVSSGNRTGGDVAVTAAEADAAFDGEFLVLDGDAERDADVPSGSATIVAVGRDGTLTVHRPGIHGDGEPLVRDLTDRWSATRPT